MREMKVAQYIAAWVSDRHSLQHLDSGYGEGASVYIVPSTSLNDNAVVSHAIISTKLIYAHLPAALAALSLFRRLHSLPLAFSTSAVT
jgi:hypothetical protein